MMVEKNLRITITVYKKLYPPVITWNEKNFLKQVAPVTDALEKKSFVVVTFEGVGVVFFFRQCKKLSVYFGLFESSLGFQRTEDQ